jgi:hypothetical protein
MTSSTPTVKAILVLEQLSGARINAKYFASELANAPEKQVSLIINSRKYTHTNTRTIKSNPHS